MWTRKEGYECMILDNDKKYAAKKVVVVWCGEYRVSHADNLMPIPFVFRFLVWISRSTH